MAAPRNLTPEQRSLRSRIAAHALHSRHDSRDLTANARAASPGSLPYWEQQVDPDCALDGRERARRAEHQADQASSWAAPAKVCPACPVEAAPAGTPASSAPTTTGEL